MVASTQLLPVVETPVKAPAAASGPPSRAPVHSTAFYIITWIVSSNFTILFNKWLIDTAGFGYPILLTCWHLFFAAVVTQVLARTTKLLDSRHALPISGRFYVRTILPIGLMASGSLVCSNFVYLYLSVAFIQMLKASAPVIVLFTSWLWGLVDPSLGTIVNILFIVSGVALASAGEISLSWIGVAFQLVGLVFEAVRVVMIQVVLSAEGYNMDPLVGLYYYAPVCAAFNFLVACVVELPHFAWEDLQKVGWLMLLLNAGVAFLLNFASMVLIGKTSGLVTTLTGIFKNILLIAFSVIIWNTEISSIQVVGYGISLLSLIYYSFGYETLVSGFRTIVAQATGAWITPGSEKGDSRVGLRRILVVGLAGMLSILVLVGYRQGFAVSLYSWVWST